MATTPKPPGISLSTTASSSDEAEKQQSPFLRIAPELRNRIYEEAFDSTVQIVGGNEGRLVEGTSLESGYGIVLACKQTHAEARGLYYSTHTFRFSSEKGDDGYQARQRCEKWLSVIGKPRWNILKRIELETASVQRAYGVTVDWASFLKAPGPLRATWADRILRSIETSAKHAYLQIGTLRLCRKSLSDAVVVASILSPAKIRETGKCSVVFTSTPEETLKEHIAIFLAKEEELAAAAEDN